jgi:hypothetical protein
LIEFHNNEGRQLELNIDYDSPATTDLIAQRKVNLRRKKFPVDIDRKFVTYHWLKIPRDLNFFQQKKSSKAFNEMFSISFREEASRQMSLSPFQQNLWLIQKTML